MSAVNICKAIDCHFCNKYGCRLFLVAGHCPLSLQSDVDNNQYWLFINNPSPAARLEELKEIHTKEVESLDTFKKRKEWDDNELQDLAWNYPD